MNQHGFDTLANSKANFYFKSWFTKVSQFSNVDHHLLSLHQMPWIKNVQSCINIKQWLWLHWIDLFFVSQNISFVICATGSAFMHEALLCVFGFVVS